MSFRPSSKKALKKYAGSRGSRVKDTQALMNKVSRKMLQDYAKDRRLDSRRDDFPYTRLNQMIPRGFVGARGDAKFFDVGSASYANDTTGSITHLSVIPQGVTVNTREGKACRVTSCNIRGRIFAGTTATFNTVASYLVWDYQPNKVIAGITDIFDSANSLSFPKRENNERFRIIKKWYCTLSGNGTAPATGDETMAIDDYVRMPEDANILCTTADTTGVIGDTIQGALYFVSLGNVAAGTAAATSTVGFRLNFTDKLN